jgi:benzoylformate decarboxylase
MDLEETVLGIEAFLDMLAAADVRYIFGNPGSTELPLSDALAGDARFQYILGLQELPLTAMADGYAMASGQLGIVCVHICCGLGNAMGMLYNAYCEGTPLIILAGQQDRRLRLGEPVLEGDMVSVTRPWTKWSVEVQRVEDVPLATRRAVQVALTPPTGPVFLSLPIDVQLARADGLDLAAPHISDPRVRPPLDALHKAAEILAQARNPAILAGGRVTQAGAVAELATLAERLGAPVLAESSASHSRLPMPADHPLYAGALPLWTPDIRQRLADFDVLFVVGMNLLRLYIYDQSARPFPEHVRLIHLDADPWEVGKNYALDVGLLGDPKVGLSELAQRVSEIQSSDQARVAAQCCAERAAQRSTERKALLAEIEAQWNQQPMTPLALMGALARALGAYGGTGARAAAQCRRGRGGAHHTQQRARAARCHPRSHWPLCASRLGVGMGIGMCDRSQAGLARSAGPGSARGRGNALWRSGTVDGGALSHPRDLRHRQQCSVQASQGRRERDAVAPVHARELPGHGPRPARGRFCPTGSFVGRPSAPGDRSRRTERADTHFL